MKKFSTPYMERINLVNQNIVAASACSSKYCCGFQCNACDTADEECLSVNPCTVHNCGRVKCPYYEGIGC